MMKTEIWAVQPALTFYEGYKYSHMYKAPTTVLKMNYMTYIHDQTWHMVYHTCNVRAESILLTFLSM